ncbi:MAG: hypothetical protein HKM95_04635 [Inquilinus sp.]|nr:hypothetical protein [Inquilinus sp.]
MITRAFWTSALFLLICCALPSNTYAADVAVVYSIDRSESDGETVQGTITVQVVNLTGGDLKNVDLRLDLGGGNLIGRGVLQVGRLEAAQVAAASGGFRLEQELFDVSTALPIRVDFDDAFGNHHSAVISAARAN